MLNSVAEFFEEDVNTRMPAALSLIEPAIMIFMGCFVAFVLIALYLPIFSLADTIHDDGLLYGSQRAEFARTRHRNPEPFFYGYCDERPTPLAPKSHQARA